MIKTSGERAMISWNGGVRGMYPYL